MKPDFLIDDLVAQLDASFLKGTGHVNVTVENGNVLLQKKEMMEEGLKKQVETIGWLDCQKQRLACGTPTLMEGLDDREEEENENYR